MTLNNEKIEAPKKKETIMWQAEKKELIKGRNIYELSYFITNWRIIKCPNDFDITLFLNGLFSKDDKKRIQSISIGMTEKIEAKKLVDKWQIKFFRLFSKLSFKNLNQKEKEDVITSLISLGKFFIHKDSEQISILCSKVSKPAWLGRLQTKSRIFL